MSKKRYIEIKNPLPKKEQETAITRLRGEAWRITTSEPAFARELQRRGYTPIEDDRAGSDSLSFEVSHRCITVRSRSAVENPHQAANLPNGDTIAEGSTPEPSKVGAKQDQDSTIAKQGRVSVSEKPPEAESPSKAFKVGNTDRGRRIEGGALQ